MQRSRAIKPSSPCSVIINKLEYKEMNTRVLEYTVILHQDEECGYWVEVPTLAGCVSQGKTKEEALKNIREAIELHLECMKEDGEEIPREESYKVAIETS